MQNLSKKEIEKKLKFLKREHKIAKRKHDLALGEITLNIKALGEELIKLKIKEVK